MEFRDIVPISKAGGPATIKAHKQGCTLSVPIGLLERQDVQFGPVRLRMAEQGRKRAIQIVPDPEGPWRLSQRKKVGTLAAAELLPARTEPNAKAATLEHHPSDKGQIVFFLPQGWELKNREVFNGG